MRIRDVYPGSEFFRTGSRAKKIPDPHKKIGMLIPDPDFFHPGCRGQKSAGSGSATLV
jgi:hypothetical protein